MTMQSIKLFALVFMTLDHIAVSFRDVMPDQLYDILRIIGRASAPLFMFALINGAKHTTDPKKYIFRLYLSNLAIAIIFIPIECAGWRGRPPQMIGTYFLTLLYIYLLDNIKNKNNLIKSVLILLIVSFVPCLVDRIVTEKICGIIMESSGDPNLSNAFRYFVRALLPDISTTEGTLLFIIMGVALYYCEKKYLQCGVILAFSALCYICFTFFPLKITRFVSFLDYHQYFMFLAVPFVMMYNGEKGKGHKLIYYLYYPLHIIVLTILGNTLI